MLTGCELWLPVGGLGPSMLLFWVARYTNYSLNVKNNFICNSNPICETLLSVYIVFLKFKLEKKGEGVFQVFVVVELSQYCLVFLKTLNWIG